MGGADAIESRRAWAGPRILPWFFAATTSALLATVTLSWLRDGEPGLLDSRLLIAGRRLATGLGGTVGEGAREVMVDATALGALATLLLIVLAVCGFLLVATRTGVALRLIGQIGGGVAVADLIKRVVDRPRPHVVAHWASVSSSSSFPSGHAADAAVTYFLLAALAADQVGSRRIASYVTGVATSIVVLVGVSRVYLGVHWPTDVLGGWAFGSGWAMLCRRRGRPKNGAGALLKPIRFSKVVVYPTQQLLEPPFILSRGGPDWPLFWFRRLPRNCRFTPAVPLDLRPRRGAEPIARREAAGIWCGPISQHFGHAVANFGSRLAAAGTIPGETPLVFSARPGEEPPAFFQPLLAHFGIPPTRVRVVSTPTEFAELLVTPQAERLHGGAPGADYFELLERLSGPAPDRDGSRVYVSRAGMWKGKIAGELHLETALQRCGYLPFRPENFTLEEQLATYRRASHLLFAEGSAVHALQLLGRIGVDVTVIARRAGSRLARSALLPRVASLDYVDAVRGVVQGVGGGGRSQPSAGMTIIDQDALVRQLGDRGIPLATAWDRAEFLAQQARDLDIWLDARMRHPTHARDQRRIARSLRDLKLRQRMAGTTDAGP